MSVGPPPQDNNEPFHTLFQSWVKGPIGRNVRTSFNDLSDEINAGTSTLQDLKNAMLLNIERSWALPGQLAWEILEPLKDSVLCDDSCLLSLVQERDFERFARKAWVPLVERTGELKMEHDDAVRLLDKAHRREFVGEGVSWILDALKAHQEMYNPRRHCGKVAAVLQSSGTGKSRTMDEVAEHHLTLSVCLRGINETEIDPYAGWPPGDKPVCMISLARPFIQHVADTRQVYLSVTTSRKMSDLLGQGEELVGAFLGALLSVAAENFHHHPRIAFRHLSLPATLSFGPFHDQDLAWPRQPP